MIEFVIDMKHNNWNLTRKADKNLSKWKYQYVAKYGMEKNSNYSYILTKFQDNSGKEKIFRPVITIIIVFCLGDPTPLIYAYKARAYPRIIFSHNASLQNAST